MNGLFIDNGCYSSTAHSDHILQTPFVVCAVCVDVLSNCIVFFGFCFVKGCIGTTISIDYCHTGKSVEPYTGICPLSDIY